jgi:rhamnosyltransferase
MVSRKRPKVGVLLAAYNGMQWIEQQLKSIIDQEGVDVTIFVSVDL